METIQYVFRSSFYSNRTWSYFSSFASITIQNMTLRGTILSWSNAQVKGREHPYYFSMPSIILWELWRRRNMKKHENKNISGLRIIYNVTRNLRMLSKVRKPELDFPNEWTNIIKEMGILNTKVNG